MRYEGRLAQWNDERGFGFIEPAQGGDKLFVHISAFAPGDRASPSRPQVGDRLSFEIEADAKGRKQARRVVRPGAVGATQAAASRASQRPIGSRRQSAAMNGLGRLAGLVLTLAVVAGIGWSGYQWWAAYGPGRPQVPAVLTQPDTQPNDALSSTAFRCDGRTMCSQMTSCAEATFFLRNCPNTTMDGNHDGVPCEQQWCTSLWAK